MAEGNPFVKTSIERSVQDLPALPSVVMRVLKETESPDACAQSVERMIAAEPALTSKVLRVVNSAYYGLSGHVTSLGQAIVILGLQQVRNLVLSVSAFSAIKPKTPRQHETLRQFWLHSFGTAAATQSICQKKRLSIHDSETAFVGGLLHDIGRLFLFNNFTQTYDQIMNYAEQKKLPVEVVERKLLGLTHSEVGGQMAEHWKLPKQLVKMITEHEGPFEGGELDELVAALHVGDWLTKDLYFDGKAIENPDPAPEILQWLSFSEVEMEWLREETATKVEDASQMFGLLAA